MTDNTDESNKDVHIGKVIPHNSTIFLAKYDPRWLEIFESEKRRILNVLGTQALLIEHAGSTSVPGLIAKPIIDIVLVVKESANESSYVPSLESVGYVLRIREPDWFEHRLLKGPDYPVNLHVFSKDCSEVDRMLLFRDYLRSNPEAKELYASTKLELSQKVWKYIQNYADAKSAVVQNIIDKALKSKDN